MSEAALRRIQQWYLRQCDGDWEHSYGVKVDTLDNPGWTVRIDLSDTPLAGEDLPRREIHRSDDDWVVCWVESDRFNAACGPLNLEEALEAFLDWSESRS